MSPPSEPAAVAAEPAAKIVPSARAVDASPTPTTALARRVCVRLLSVRMLPLPCSPRGGSLEPSWNVGAVSANRLGGVCWLHGWPSPGDRDDPGDPHHRNHPNDPDGRQDRPRRPGQAATLARMDGFTIRAAHPGDYERLGELTAAAYLDDG